MKQKLCTCGHTSEQHYHNFITVGCRICDCTSYKESKPESEACPVCGKTDLAHPAHTFRCYEIEKLWKERDTLRAELSVSKSKYNELQEELETAKDIFEKIDNWTKAYPLDIFPVPDLEKARKLLADGGITLDAVSAAAMRHVITRLGAYITEVLKETGK